ncbi:barstar family protein [Paenibacillus sp.]|jgi:RNAse (barnase) inhibitor barstar|uniref:barstar family protein n=1 Tax=Paenibacillus sp. TaxID=58172 RepID=UPI002832A488|nr:barstar family protein [Paenibacillus sp.]MDR0267234.1 barstar family protein [Paenibacillus sp.]
MGYKFSIIDNESGKVLGFCKEVSGLQNEFPKRDDECWSTLILYDFKLMEEFNDAPKICLSNFDINFISRNGTILGGYYFTTNKKMNIKRMESLQDAQIEITGYFGEDPLPFAYEVWEKLRDNPNELGQWVSCTLEEKRAWLQVLRLRSREFHTLRDKEQVITIDGELIQDRETFYIALGEAVNGPFGYYGACLNGFEDCLCGDFGLVPPFTLEWINFHKSFEAELIDHAEFIFFLHKILSGNGVKVVYR